MSGAMQSTAKLAPLEVNVLLKDMRASGLASSEEFKALEEQQGLALQFSNPPSYSELKSNVLRLLETYNLLCAQDCFWRRRLGECSCRI